MIEFTEENIQKLLDGKLTLPDTLRIALFRYGMTNRYYNKFYGFADEKYSRKIAKNIVDARKRKEIETTFELVKIIENSVPSFYKNSKSNCSTKTFQALRIATNKELENVSSLLKSFKNILKENGRAGLITFHSTEDRVVKMTAKEEKLKPVNKKVIIATRQEEIDNPRSRSAKLRVYTI